MGEIVRLFPLYSTRYLNLELVLMPFVTLGFYQAYRFIRSVHRRNQHFQRTKAFYQLLPNLLRQLPHASETLTGETAELLEDYELWVTGEEATTLRKPLYWKPLAVAWGILFLLIIAYYAFMFNLGFSQSMAGHSSDPMAVNKAILSIQPYIMLSYLIIYPSGFYSYYLKYRLLKDYPQLDKMESKFLSFIQPILQKFLGDTRLSLSFEPQCKPRNFWLHLLLLFPTLGINFLYLDYCCIHEAQRRFKESARVQYRILQAVKKLAEQSANEVTTS